MEKQKEALKTPTFGCFFYLLQLFLPFSNTTGTRLWNFMLSFD